MLLNKFIVGFFLVFCINIKAQNTQKESARPTLVTTASSLVKIHSLKGKKLISESVRSGEVNPKRKDANKIVPGKGLPKNQDPLLSIQQKYQSPRSARIPSLIFEANASGQAPTDPTGAVGPNHYVSAKNSAFAIHDKNGAVLIPSTGLENLFPGENLGDPIVFYDSFADRFVITQFSDSPNGFLVAVCQGSDPVNDGWYTYRFETGSFPDYTKFSIWSDGYYITANKDQGQQRDSEVVFVIERNKMLRGEANVKMIGFPLPGARIGGFYSPAGFNAIGNVEPPIGDARIIYFQDDDWEGVDSDALKMWRISVDWINPNQSSITEAEVLSAADGNISPFDSTFDGGSFSNLPQPGSEGQNIDVLQGAIMYATNYRRFCDYNSVVLNFAVDIDDRANSDNISAIRWYELRQNGDGQPWSVHQEGTFASPDGKSAWCASMAMDIYGNIGMGYTTMGTIDNGAVENSFPSIRYTGRLASDPLGVMTFSEETIALGNDIQRNGGVRYGDYAQLTVDPEDELTFWHIGEYFRDTDSNARNVVGVFKIATDKANDVGIIAIDNPVDNVFSSDETVTVTIKNFGTSTQTNIPVSYSINGGASVVETFSGNLDPGETAIYSFTKTADLTIERIYTINAETNLISDETTDNDCTSAMVNNLFPNDLGIIDLISPELIGSFSDSENITVTIYNYGGNPQSNIPVFYQIDSGTSINEVFTGTIAPGESANYTFSQTANLLDFGRYDFLVGTSLPSDENTVNDNISRTVEHQQCSPTSDCSRFGDGITYFALSNIENTNISCTTGYEDYTDLTINLDRALGVYNLIVRTGFAQDDTEQMSIWIDFNDNTIFEEEELIISQEVLTQENTNLSLVLTIPVDAALGSHTMRVRAGDTTTNSGSDLNEPCGSMQFGTTHDYTVMIGENTSPTTSLIVFYQTDNQFLITMSDSTAPDSLRIFVYSISGQVLATNLIKKDANSRFVYNLDMSYASTGMYFIKLGNKTKKIMVR